MKTFPITCATGGPDLRRRRGGVLAIVMIAVLTVAAVSAGMLQLGGAVTRRQASSVNIKLAFYMAEAGLAESYSGLVIGKTGNVGTEQDPARFGNGLFWVEATDNPDGTVTLESTGMVGNGRAELSLVIEPTGKSVATLGIFSDQALEVEKGASLDGWNSGDEGYGQPAGGGGMMMMGPVVSAPMGRLGSNGTVQIEGGAQIETVIDGDVTPGPNEQVVTTGNVTINGSTSPALAATPLPVVDVPVFTQDPGISHGGATPLLLQPGKAGIEYLRVREDAKVVIQGPSVLVMDSLVLEQEAELVFDTAGGVIGLYVLQELDFDSDSVFSVTGGDPSQLVIQVAGSTAAPVRLAGEGDFYGILYAPEADVQVYPEFEVFGSVVAQSLQLNGGVKLHFDQYLVELASELALPKLVSWRIVELSNPAGMAPGEDPFTFLGLDPLLSQDPAGSHADVTLKVDYLDLASSPQVYDGPESAFDWSQVKQVTEISRDGKGVDPAGRGLTEIGGGTGGLLNVK